MGNRGRKQSVWISIFAACVFSLGGCGILENRNEQSEINEHRLETERGTEAVSPQPATEQADAPLSLDQILITTEDVPESALSRVEEEGTLEKFSYASGENGAKKDKYAYVYLPHGYDPADESEQYDIMYLFHGYGGSVSTFFGSPDDPRDMKNVADHLIADGRMRPMVIVSATYYPENTDPETDNYDIEILQNFREELMEVLIPAVEGYYHTYAETLDAEGIRASRDHRILAGFSMGGVLVWERLCDSMDAFRYYMSMSGPIRWSGWNIPDAGEYLQKRIAEQGYGAEDFYLYIVTGEEDFALPPLQQQIDSMKKQSSFFRFNDETADGNAVFWIGDGEAHRYHAKRRYLYNALPVLSECIALREKTQ